MLGPSAPHAPPFVTLFGCVSAHLEDWAVVAQHGSYGPFVVVFGQPKIVACGVAAVCAFASRGEVEECEG
jgi:hypothetical protein